MNEKTLEKLIVEGFKTQDKKIAKGFEAQDKKMEAIKKSIEIDMVTQDDLSQVLGNQTEKIVDTLSNIYKRFDRLGVKIDRLDLRANEDVSIAYKKIEQLEKRVQILETQGERISA